MALQRKKEVKVRGVWEKVRGSDVWWIHYTDAEGHRRREKVGRKSDAIDLLQQRRADATAGRKIERPLRERERTFEELADNAIEYAKKHKAHPGDDEQKIGILTAEFGDRPAAKLTQQDLAAFLESRNTSPATFNRYRATLSMIYREAIRNGWTDRNPARLIKAKKEDNGRIRYLLPEEEVRLHKVIAETCSDRFLNETEIAVNTGMRRGEQFSIRWSQVDLPGKKLRLLKTKNGSPRTIPLNSIALAAFKRQLKVSAHHTHVFLNDEGEPFANKARRHWFEDALKAAKIREFTWHDQRHTFCSRLAMAGVPLKTIQELAGHKTIQMTARYAHLSPDHLQDAVELITATEQPLTRLRKPTATRTATRPKKVVGKERPLIFKKLV